MESNDNKGKTTEHLLNVHSSSKSRKKNYKLICLYCLGSISLSGTWLLFFILGTHYEQSICHNSTEKLKFD